VSGCVVLGLHPFYDARHLVIDDRVLGRWDDAEDGASVVIERSDWRSYRITFTQQIESGALTGYLFKAGPVLLMDLAPVRGRDPGSFVVAGHALVRLRFDDAGMHVAPLDAEQLSRALKRGALSASLRAVLGERRQLVFGGTAAALHRWIVARAASDTLFSAEYTFQRVP
jgi:hypothetical protein